jgi:hypothetical protein
LNPKVRAAVQASIRPVLRDGAGIDAILSFAPHRLADAATRQTALFRLFAASDTSLPKGCSLVPPLIWLRATKAGDSAALPLPTSVARGVGM